MKNLKEKIKSGLIVGAVTLVGLVGLSWILGGEPVIFGSDPRTKLPDVTFKEYCEQTRANKLMCYLAFPGAKVGRLVHNYSVISD